MVRLRWTFALIIILVTLLATVITAFRIRDLQKGSHESVSEFKKKQKCEDCDVNKHDLDQKLHIHKSESGKRSIEDLKKPAQEKKQSPDEKTFEKFKSVPEQTDENRGEDEDGSNENLIYLRQLASKWEEKQKASGVISETDTKPLSDRKKVTVTISNNNKARDSKIKDDNEDDQDDDDDDDDDESDTQIKSNVISNKKTVGKINNNFIKDKPFMSIKKISGNDNDEHDDDDDDNNDDDEYKIEDNDNDDEITVTIGKPKEKIPNIVLNVEELDTTLKPMKQSKIITKGKSTTKATVDEVEKKDSFKTNDIKITQPAINIKKSEHRDIGNKEIRVKDKVTEKLKIADKSAVSDLEKNKVRLHKDLLDKYVDKKDLNKHSKDVKMRESKKDKEIKIKPKVPVENILSTEEIHVKSDKNDSQEESRLKHVTDALRRRNLLKSEFEDFYAFLPTFAPNFTRVQNAECRRHGQILLRQLRGTKLWALNMLDATGKVPSGILRGNGIQLGNFDQCLGSHARVQLDTGSVVKVHGKYCLARIDLKAEHPELEIPVYLAQAKNLIKSRIDDPGHFVPRFSTLSWGVCVPSPCHPEDVEDIIRDAIKHYQYTSGVSIRVKVDSKDCHMHKKQAWWEAWLGLPTLLTLSLYGVVILLVLIATAQDFVGRRKDEDSTKDESDQRDSRNDKDVENVKQPEADNVISAFSLYRTVGKLVAPATSDEISCIHGVRAIATIALLVAHKFLPVAVMPYTNRVKITEVVSSPLWSWCRAGWMYTDCFLLLSGTLTAHRISNDNESGALKRIVSRYLRLTPALLAVILFYAYIWDNISVGPMWGGLVTKNAEICQQGWWWNILYVQNYFSFDEMCAPQTHQLALDMQLSILGGLIVWAMQSELPVLRALLPTLHVWTAFSRYKTTREHRLTLLAYHGVSVSQLHRTARLSYTSVIHRSTPYLVGLSLGLALKNNTRHSKILMVIGWLVCGTLWALVWWAGFDSGSTQYRYSATFSAQYAALAPISSALAIAWLIYAVHSGHCDFLHNILCSRPLAFVSRLTYALYLSQFIVFLTNAATVKNSIEFSLISLIDVQEITSIFFVSLLLTLTFVIPMQSLTKIVLLLSISKSHDNMESINLEINQKQTDSVRKNEKVLEPPLVRNRQTLIAHREVLEEIPEVETEYENRHESNDGLEEILEEEEDEEGMDQEREHLEDEDLEIIEGEQRGGDEDFWKNRQDSAQGRSFSRNSDRDLDDWELTGNGNGRSGAQSYRYYREQ